MDTYEQLFALIDLDRSGSLELGEVLRFSNTLPQPPNPAMVERLFHHADMDHSNSIDVDEFGALCEGLKSLCGGSITEEDMVKIFATAELRKVFDHACGGRGMSREKLRQTITLLTEAMDIFVSDDAVATAMRKIFDSQGKKECSYEEFEEVIRTLFPNRALSSLADALLQVERKREEQRKQAYANFGVVRGSMKLATLKPKKDTDSKVVDTDIASCKRCKELEKVTSELCTLKTVQLPELNDRVKELEEQLTMSGVASNAKMNKLRNRCEELERSSASQSVEAKEMNEVLKQSLEDEKRKAKELRQQLESSEMKARRLSKEKQDAEELVTALTREVKTQDTQISTLKFTLANTKERLKEIQGTKPAEPKTPKSEDKQNGVQKSPEANEDTISDLADTLQKLNNELSEKDRQVEECLGRIESLSTQLAEQETYSKQVLANVVHREEELAKHEKAREEEWKEKFEESEKRLSELESRLSVKELDLVQHEAELVVREQRFESHVRTIESISLPERERRMRLLQSIEEDLHQREKALREKERTFVDGLIASRIEVFVKYQAQLEDENALLQREVDMLKSHRLHIEAQAKQSVEGVGRLVQSIRGVTSPSVK